MRTLKSLCAVVILLFALPLYAGEKILTIIHTNDLHSHLMGFPPELDFTPDKTGDDATLGGWARVATVIRREKAARANPSLVLDAFAQWAADGNRPLYPHQEEAALALAAGDHVVHVGHGIGVYRGVTRLAKDGVEREYLILEYQEKAKLYVLSLIHI